jgi:hypothetical protein
MFDCFRSCKRDTISPVQVSDRISYDSPSRNVAFIEADDEIVFPEFTGINVNMMPIQASSRKKGFQPTLPKECEQYTEMVMNCLEPQYTLARFGYIKAPSVVYLTVMETEVDANHIQRRGGVHIDRHNGFDLQENCMSQGYHWGIGHMEGWGEDFTPIDGIYLANNVSNSCQIYPCKIDSPEIGTDAHGGLDDKRKQLLPDPIMMKPNRLYWITDTTPHEALPVNTRCKRQFFRLVVGPISHWFSQHNTPSPLGVQPKCPIVHMNKFSQ